MTATATAASLPLRVRLEILARLLAVQGSWNYELMLGTGLGFAIEPALRMLPGGKRGAAYHDALSRQSGYFNAHPYLASIAAGALARAELDGEPHERIARFRTALCSPLGSLGDRLIWSGLLPVCSLIALFLFGFGASPLAVVAVFLLLYNAAHFSLRIWGLNIGWTHGLKVASALGSPILQAGPAYIARFGAALVGVALPLSVNRLLGAALVPTAAVLLGAVAGAVLIVRAQGSLHGWSIALIALGLLAALAFHT